jgi:hypothetical protein
MKMEALEMFDSCPRIEEGKECNSKFDAAARW